MDKNVIQKIKEDLLRQRDSARAELEEFAKANQNVANEYTSEFPDYGDQSDENAQEVSQYTTDLETGRILESNLKDIDSALKAIDNNTYGICKYCGQEIEEKRLLFRPFSSACVKCKMKLQNNS